MQLFKNIADARVTQPTVLTIGTFDGLHLGHQDVLSQLKAVAKANHAQTAVIAFHPRPKAVFAPDRFKNDYLTTPQERISLFEKLGIDVLILTPFTLELAQTSARDFVKCFTDCLNVVKLCVGHDFALGKNREGNIEKLTELGREFNYTVHTIKPFTLDHDIVSSTKIRSLLRKGQVKQAAKLLGRYPVFSSHIVQGAQRGRTIGFPTANFAVSTERLLPAYGVYATFFQLADNPHRYFSVTNVGIRPTFDGHSTRTVEAYIFEFEGNIYHQPATLEFVEYIRPEKKFDGIDALVAQISRDVTTAKAILTREFAAAD